MTVFLVVLAVVVVVGLAVLSPRLLMGVKASKLKGKPAPTLHKASARRIKSGSKTILYFSTSKCRACGIQDPIVRKVQRRYPDAIFKIDAAANRQAASAYGVMGVPYLAFIEGGTIVAARAGVQQEETIVEFLSGGRKALEA